MTPERRTTILFWCQVWLYVTAMVTMLGLLGTLILFVISQMNALEVDRARDRAMLQQHHTELQQYDAAMRDHEALMQRLVRP